MALTVTQRFAIQRAIDNLGAALKCATAMSAIEHIRNAQHHIDEVLTGTPARQTAEQTEVGPHPECSVRTGDALTGLCACGHLVAAHRHRQGDRSIAGSVECVLCRALTWPPR